MVHQTFLSSFEDWEPSYTPGNKHPRDTTCKQAALYNLERFQTHIKPLRNTQHSQYSQ